MLNWWKCQYQVNIKNGWKVGTKICFKLLICTHKNTHNICAAENIHFSCLKTNKPCYLWRGCLTCINCNCWWSIYLMSKLHNKLWAKGLTTSFPCSLENCLLKEFMQIYALRNIPFSNHVCALLFEKMKELLFHFLGSNNKYHLCAVG